MKNLTDLFKLLEITRSVPQTGYAMIGFRQNELSNLAEHHYLVAFFAWQIARHLKRKGAKINIEKVLEFALIHDLGELFGGDISMYYGSINPKAKKLAKEFEEENQIFLAEFFGDDRTHFKSLSKEILDARSDEAIIAKIADYLEIVYYKFYIKGVSKFSKVIGVKLQDKIKNVKDAVAKRELKKFIGVWSKDFPQNDIIGVLNSKNSKKARK